MSYLRILSPFSVVAAITSALVISAPAWASWSSSGSLFLEDYLVSDGVLSSDASTYYAVGDSNSLRVIDVATRSVRSSVDIGQRARAVRLSSDESRLWAIGSTADEVIALSTSDMSTTTEISVFNSPWDLDFTDSGNYVFVSSGVGNDNVGKGTIIDTSTQSVVATIDLGEVPDSLDVVGDDVAYVANYSGESGGDSSRRITKVDFSTPDSPIVVWNTTVEEADYVQANPTGTEIWVGTGASGDIVVLDPDGTVLRTISSLDRSDEIVFNSSGSTAAVLKANSNPSAIFLMDAASGAVRHTISLAADSLDGFDFSRSGDKLIVADGGGYGSSDSTLLFYELIQPAVKAQEPQQIERASAAGIHLDAGIEEGSPSSGATLLAEGEGLARGQAFTVKLNPGAQILTSGTASRLGYFSTTTGLPAGLTPGTYTLTLTTNDPAGNPLVLTERFGIDQAGMFTAPSAPTAEPVTPATTPADSEATAEVDTTSTDTAGTTETSESDAPTATSTTGDSAASAEATDEDTNATPATSQTEMIPGWLVVTASVILIALVLGGIATGIYRTRRPRSW